VVALAWWLLSKPHLDVLITHQLHTGTPMLSPTPVTPEERKVLARETASFPGQAHANLAQAITLIPLFIVHSQQWIWVVYIFAFVETTISQFFDPAKMQLFQILSMKSIC
jgi:hypothetical protein